jgi:O-antigen ligase
MDPDEVADDPPRRRRRRRRRHRSEEAPPPAEPLGLWTTVRQLAGLGVFGLFFLLIVAAPIPMGSNRDWAWGPMVVAIGVLALLCAAGIGGREGFKVSAEESTPLLALIVCFLLFVVVALVQMSMFAPLSPSASLYVQAGELLGQVLVPVPTLAVDATRDALLKCIGCAAMFMIARVLFHDARWAKLMVMVFVLSAAIVMTYAVYMSVATHSCYVGSYLKKEGTFNFTTDRCLASGTFVGSNNFGCFCGMAFVAALGLMIDGRRSRRSREEYSEEDEYGDGSSHIADWFSGRRVILAALALYFLGGLMLSASRAGAAVTAIGAIALIYLLLRGSSRATLKWAAIGGGLLTVVVLVVAGEAFLHKLSLLADSGNLSRVVIWRSSIAAMLDSPWLGWGLGSYGDIYTIHQPPTITQPNDKAHSTPLEFLVEMGIVGGVPALAVCLIPWGICLIGALRRRQRQLAAIAFSVSAVAILHSTIDFSLQMPAIGFIVSALLGAGWAHAFSSTERQQRPFATDA